MAIAGGIESQAMRPWFRAYCPWPVVEPMASRISMERNWLGKLALDNLAMRGQCFVKGHETFGLVFR